VHVARLAGVPAPTVKRAAALLASLEKGREKVTASLPLFDAVPEAPAPDPLRVMLDGVDPDTLSARDALALVYRLMQAMKEEKS
jgi:DNA mismatch repair protein MutS